MDKKMIGWLALDLVGTLFFVAGAMGLFGGGSMLPEAWRFSGHNLVLVILGVAMMAPYMVYVIRKGRTKQQS